MPLHTRTEDSMFQTLFVFNCHRELLDQSLISDCRKVNRKACNNSNTNLKEKHFQQVTLESRYRDHGQNSQRILLAKNWIKSFPPKEICLMLLKNVYSQYLNLFIYFQIYKSLFVSSKRQVWGAHRIFWFKCLKSSSTLRWRGWVKKEKKRINNKWFIFFSLSFHIKPVKVSWLHIINIIHWLKMTFFSQLHHGK